MMNLQERYNAVLEEFPDAPDRFELTVKEVYQSVLREGATAMDLGAHTGKHALPMARAVGPTGRVFAFEPILEKFKTLCENAENAGLVQLSSFNVCCLDENTVVEFIYLPKDPGKSAIHVRKNLEAEEIEKARRQTLAIRLDDFFLNGLMPAFMKIDIEGAELMALRGAAKLIERARPVLHIEVGPPSLAAFGVAPGDIFQFLADANYVVYDILGESLPDIEAYLESVNATGVYDYVACPASDEREAVMVNACKRMWRR